ncbi:hypothetical protein pRL70108 (plasmid) [Rhizobium johnstonii 3841]|uniref:Uncharacterized protein n=1 Tax=Rhizobium johnstonii (strain DSM 114642 / LMG 32736 / 3841) TaxID=216596 RepID=Q1M9S0_RHIJ3|nr:hypothetical protein pRL70108 [Rhizobium johnstonii 3841]
MSMIAAMMDGKRSFCCALTHWIVTPAAAYAAVDLAKFDLAPLK